MNIGLLMVSGEDDILEATLARNAEFVDLFYVLDAGGPVSRGICERHPKCAGWTADADLPDGYPLPVRDGCRQYLYEQAAAEHGRNHWFLLLHGDEVWTGLPDDLDSLAFDGYQFRLPFYFPRAGEPWDDTRHPLDQLVWSFWPGFPEFRMFHGSNDVNYAPGQHANVNPSGISRVGMCDHPIKHYLYRSPAAQRARAIDRVATGFDEGNYRHIVDSDAVYFDDAMIGHYTSQEWFHELRHEETVAA